MIGSTAPATAHAPAPRMAALLLAVSVTLGATWARADGMIRLPEGDIALGPSVAYAHGPRSGVALNFDTAYTQGVFAASLNLKYVGEPDFRAYGAQAEGTIWLLANFGGGFGYLGGTEPGPVLHLFAGVPLPLARHHFVEPYYRANFLLADEARTIHEVGLMIKYTSFGM
jgi:hypothetical protein